MVFELLHLCSSLLQTQLSSLLGWPPSGGLQISKTASLTSQVYSFHWDMWATLHSFSLLHVSTILCTGYTMMTKIYIVPLLWSLWFYGGRGTWNWLSQTWEDIAPETLLWRVARAPAARSCRSGGVGECRHSLPIGNKSVTGSAVSLSSPCNSNPEMTPETLVWGGELEGWLGQLQPWEER